MAVENVTGPDPREDDPSVREYEVELTFVLKQRIAMSSRIAEEIVDAISFRIERLTGAEETNREMDRA